MFGFQTETVDGHSFPDLIEAFSQIGKTECRPLMVIANTVKGKGIPLMENEPRWHYWQPLDKDTQAQIRRDLVHAETTTS